MKIRFRGHRPRDLVALHGRTVQPGEVIDVSDAVGRRLLEQPRWYEAVEDKPAAKAKPKTEEGKP